MPTAPATPPPAIAATTEAILTAINELCEAHAKAQVARGVAEQAPTKAGRDDHLSRAQYWDRQTHTLHRALVDVVRTVTPPPSRVETFLPVRTLPNGHVELHARDQHSRPVVVALTGAEAVTVGVHLTAHAAIGLDRTGTRVDRVLPPMLTDPPTATTGDAPATGRAAAAIPAPPAR
ncbi:hypothetical protein [Krasilnikovia sp. MM14-A1259]|uniref:hypothetical protein n=1 Tax=Krasilnikovia sp. MM14-A1259 TaxID=3373539 RepID=UPI0038296AB2